MMLQSLITPLSVCVDVYSMLGSKTCLVCALHMAHEDAAVRDVYAEGFA